jgi:hypothetical protein
MRAAARDRIRGSTPERTVDQVLECIQKTFCPELKPKFEQLISPSV